MRSLNAENLLQMSRILDIMTLWSLKRHDQDLGAFHFFLLSNEVSNLWSAHKRLAYWLDIALKLNGPYDILHKFNHTLNVDAYEYNVAWLGAIHKVRR